MQNALAIRFSFTWRLLPMRNWLFLIPILCFFNAYGQKEIPWNYRKFDNRTMHFGFMLGINSSSFTVYPELNAYQLYGLKSVIASSTPGGQLGVLTTIKLGTPVVRLRFIPTLSFQERVLNYTFVNPNPNAKTDLLNEERINSTNLDFPLMLQFRTLRYNNFAAYLLVGAQYTLDLQTQEKASQSLIDPFIKIHRNDYSAQVGGGVEFFAPFFKFGIELKYSRGMTNAFIQDGTPVSLPIHSLYNNVWWFSLIFEG